MRKNEWKSCSICVQPFSRLGSQNRNRLTEYITKKLKEKRKIICTEKTLIHFSFEYGVANFLGQRLQRAIEFTHMRNFWPTDYQPTIVVSGGVACNIRIRSVLQKVKKHCPFEKYSKNFDFWSPHCTWFQKWPFK